MKKIYLMKQLRQELLFYLVVWALLFAAPPLTLYIRSVSDGSLSFDWTEVFIVWRKFAVYLLLFIAHNFLLAPLLVQERRRVAYFSIVTAIIIGFAVYQCSSKPVMIGAGKPEMERERPRAGDGMPEMGGPEMGGPAKMEHRPEPPHHDMEHDGRPMPPPRFRHDKKPPIMGEREIMVVVLLVLMFGANLGIKGYFHSRDDRKRLAELEKQNLAQQLEYLRYQINPHFFMNTLNNIHALVDIDPAKAQETIVELSKMMRFILYEGDKRGVPLTKEMEFIRTYVKLMKLRYTDKVRISLDLPTEVPDRSVPPLIFISFIENAFKHGVSYQRESFIEVKMSLEDGSLHFSCRNSKPETPPQTGITGSPPQGGAGSQQGGVGLANVRKRLDLIYEKNYTLSINDNAGVYAVELAIPIQS